MDPKASAKSKRSHTQHARKVHAPAAAIAHKKKAAAEKAPAHPHKSSLPSNWDRYDDGSSEEISSKQRTGDGEAAPRSKGADVGYLLEQARSQPKDFGSSSIDELNLDFMRGFSSMLSARGKRLISLCEDDNFVVDDDPTASFEIPFLSLDLNALSEQLSKLKLSHRLSIEAELLPEELGIDEESNKSSALKEPETPEPAQFDQGFVSKSSMSPLISSNNANQSTEQESSKSPEVGQSSRSQSKSDTDPDTKQNKIPRFEVAAAEAELDMLLGSLSETAVCVAPKSSNFDSYDPVNGQPISQSPATFRDIPVMSIGDSIDDLLQNASFGLSINQDSGLSRNVIATSIDDSIDDLLSKTSHCLRDQSSKSMNTYPTTTRAIPADSIDASIDDLLAETSALLKDQKLDTAPSLTGVPVQTHSTVSKAADDFDSWLDSL